MSLEELVKASVEFSSLPVLKRSYVARLILDGAEIAYITSRRKDQHDTCNYELKLPLKSQIKKGHRLYPINDSITSLDGRQYINTEDLYTHLISITEEEGLRSRFMIVKYTYDKYFELRIFEKSKLQVPGGRTI